MLGLRVAAVMQSLAACKVASLHSSPDGYIREYVGPGVDSASNVGEGLKQRLRAHCTSCAAVPVVLT